MGKAIRSRRVVLGLVAVWCEKFVRRIREKQRRTSSNRGVQTQKWYPPKFLGFEKFVLCSTVEGVRY